MPLALTFIISGSYAFDSAHVEFDVGPKDALVSHYVTEPVESYYFGRSMSRLLYSIESKVTFWSRRIQLFDSARPKYGV